MKGDLRGLLADRRFDEITRLAGRRKRVLALLVALTYDADDDIAWRALEALGPAAARIAADDPEHVLEQLRRLHWLLSEESGGICWHGPEAMAEIIRHRPNMFSAYVPIVAHLLVEMAEEDLDHFRAGILWAIGRMGRRAADSVADVIPEIVVSLDHADPQIRGRAVWCLSRLGRRQVLVEREHLLCDDGEVEMYEDGALVRTSVARVTESALMVG
jgi:hypothetical protein